MREVIKIKREYTLEKFKELYDKEIKQTYRVSAEYVYEQYYGKIFLYLDLITKYQNLDKPINQDELRIGLGVSHSAFQASKAYFPEFKAKLDSKYNTMKFKSERDLLRGIDEAHSNPKLLEMQMKLYNDEWKEKNSTVEFNLPNTIKIEIEDASMNEKDLEPYDPNLEKVK